jgi:hypothetical protein
MVFEQSQKAIEFVEKGNVIPDEDGRAIVDCINNSDHQILKKLTAKYKLIY